MNLRCELSELLLRACVSCLISSIVVIVVFAEEDRLAVLQSFVLPKPVYPLASIERGALTRNKNNKPPSRNFAVLNHLCSAFRSSNERRHRAAETESEWRQVSSAVHLQDQVETSVKVIIIETAKLRSASNFSTQSVASNYRTPRFSFCARSTNWRRTRISFLSS